MESSHRWTFVGYFSTQQVPIGLPGQTDGRTDGRVDYYMPPFKGIKSKHFSITPHITYICNDTLLEEDGYLHHLGVGSCLYHGPHSRPLHLPIQQV